MATETFTGLARPEILLPVPDVQGRRIMVTGSSGFIGSRVVDLLGEHGAHAIEFDLPNWTVMEPFNANPGWTCLHLAAHKYATTAEDDPAAVAELNIKGTQNVVDVLGA